MAVATKLAIDEILKDNETKKLNKNRRKEIKLTENNFMTSGNSKGFGIDLTLFNKRKKVRKKYKKG